MAQRYQHVVEEIYRLKRFRGSLSLEPVQELMTGLDHPEHAFPAVHVAGTNGKGSTATMIARVLEAAGYTTGLYTSPHLVDVTERIQVDGDPIDEAAVVDSYHRIADIDVEASFFEAMTGIAFDHFREQDVDVAVVETGMGGRLDATNIVDPMLSVITNVAREHTTVLGETPEQIAYEIAGIIDTAPVVSGATGEPSDVIDAVAEAAEVPVNEVPGRASIVHDDRQALTLAIDGTPVETGLLGRYQVDNVDTVLEAVETIPLPVPDAAVRDALGGVQIPGRMEPVADAPLVLLDGAHNPAAVDRLPATLDRIDCDTVVAVVSIMADKEYGEMLSTIDGFADDIILSEAGIDRAADPADLAAALDAEPVVESSIPAALRAAADTAAPRDAVLVTGSLYFVGDVKETIEQRPEIIAART